MLYLPQADGEGHPLQLPSREVEDLLVKQILHLQWFQYVCHELRVDVGITNLVVQKLPDSAREFGTDLLWLVAHIHLRYLL